MPKLLDFPPHVLKQMERARAEVRRPVMQTLRLARELKDPRNWSIPDEDALATEEMETVGVDDERRG